MGKVETNEEYINRVNGYNDAQIKQLIDDNLCPYEPERDGPSPMGMYHCPICGEMVLANCKHPRYDDEFYRDVDPTFNVDNGE